MEFYASDRATYEKFADGKVKDISEEIPFELAQGWAWTRIGAVFYLQAGKNISSQCIKEHSAGYPYPCYGGNGVRGYVKKSSHKGIHAVIGRQGALCGNLNLTHDEFYATEHAVVVETFSEVTADFAYWFLKQMNLNQYATATAQPGLSVREIVDVMFPLPPLAEQKRIVTKIEELFAYVDKIGEASDGITQAAQRLDKKILDLAIRGQLVPQDPNDEPASELIKRIEAAKKITEKGRKSSRAAASDRPAYETEAPFDIPDSWEWVQLGSISNYGECKSVDAHDVAADTWSLDLEEIEKGTGRLLCRKHAGEKTSTSSKHVFSKGMILYSKLRTYLNKVLVADRDGVCTSEIIPIALYDNITPEYIRLVLMSSYFLAYTASKDYGVKMPRIGTSDARAALIPLPPIDEQRRIVAKVEEFKAMIRNLVNS